VKNSWRQRARRGDKPWNMCVTISMTRQGNCLRKNPVANVHWWSTRMANERTQWPHRHSSAMVKTRGKEYPPPPSAQKSSRTPARKVKNKVGSPAARASQGLAAIAVASSSAQVEDNYTNYETPVATSSNSLTKTNPTQGLLLPLPLPLLLQRQVQIPGQSFH
jgi:hypothetical protein